MAFMMQGHFLSALLGLVCLLSCLEIANIIAPKDRLLTFLAVVFFLGLFMPVVFGKNLTMLLLFGLPMLFISNAVVLFATTIDRLRFEKVSAIFYWSAYVSFGMMSLFLLVNSSEALDPRLGLSLVLLACLSTWGNDTFAYFGGRLFGKHPLFKAVSSKKTWEGFFSGGILSVVGIFVVAVVTRSLKFDLFLGLENYDLLWVTLPSVILAPLGDLMESRLKRLYDTKDSSNILPGHGGLLDRIDGLLLVLPWTALYAFIIRPLC